MMESKTFLTKAAFSIMIENAVRDHRVSYMDAVIDVCKDHEVEIEEVRKFISTQVKDKIEAEARHLNFLPRTNMLPLD